MDRRIVLAVLAAAAVAVSPAFAAKKKDTYELKGTLSAYTAAVDTTPGSLTILVTKANHAGQPFVVPTQANNPEGGLEFIRMLVSKENARFFSEYAQALTSVAGAADDLELGTAFNSAKAVVEAAGDQIMASPKYSAWYQTLGEEITVQMGSLLGGQIDPDGFIDAVQAATDEIANDESIPKFTRES